VVVPRPGDSLPGLVEQAVTDGADAFGVARLYRPWNDEARRPSRPTGFGQRRRVRQET
jgi:hypothetical protein